MKKYPKGVQSEKRQPMIFFYNKYTQQLIQVTLKTYSQDPDFDFENEAGCDILVSY